MEKQIKKILADDTLEYYFQQLHRGEDGPVVIRHDGTLEYFFCGQRHRVDGPARIWPNGRTEYWQHGQLHRDPTQGPALIWPDGQTEYWQHGQRHRDPAQGPALIWPDGTLEYFFCGQRHRVDGPARIWPNGTREYFLHYVHVPAWLVLRPASFSAKKFLEEKNTSVRREIIRRVGIEQVLRVLKVEVVDRQGDYELLVPDMGDSRKRPYLKMRNPSLSTYHIEGVHPSCQTVAQALAWRNSLQEYSPPEVLS